MATVSVLPYNQPAQIFNMRSNMDENLSCSNSNSNSSIASGNTNSSQLTKNFSKIIVQNVLSENNGNTLNINNNAIVRKIKDFGMFGSLHTKRALNENKTRELVKPQVLLNKKAKITKDNTTTTPKTSKKQSKDVSNNLNDASVAKRAGTPGRKGLPLPQAVARRNARERNRVKQVNNGFAALRERIPEEVAEAFEVQGSGRSAKKLSKVETLRMAVEYIRSLERLLGFEFPNMSDNVLLRSTSTSGSDSNLQSSPDGTEHEFSLIKDEFDGLSPKLEQNFDDSLSNYDVDEYFANSSGNNSEFLTESIIEQQTNVLPNITTLNGLQYIRIPGTNTYQLLTDNLFVNNNANSPAYQTSLDDEQINTIIDSKCISPNLVGAAEANLIGVSKISTSQIAPVLTATRSPVPQATSSPNATSPALQAQQQQQQQQHQQQQLQVQTQPALLSPAANELLLQTCAVDHLSNNITQQQQQQQQTQLILQTIKQECNDSGEYTATSTNSTLIYQQPAQTYTISPPLETNIGGILPTYFAHNQSTTNGSTCFQKLLPNDKKLLNGVLLDAATELTEEGMMEALDWWDAHTPKSDNSSTHI